MKYTTIVTIALLALATSVFAQVSGGRIVTVDLSRVFTEYYKTAASSAKLKETAESYNKERDELVAQHRKLAAELDKFREEQEKPEYTEEVRRELPGFTWEKTDKAAELKGLIV